MISSERIRELKIDSTFWATPTKIVNLLDFDPKIKSIDTELNSISNTPDASSKDLIEVQNRIELIFLKVLTLISVKKHLRNVVYVNSIIF